MTDDITILNARLTNVTTGELLARLGDGMLLPVNVDVIMKLQVDEELYRAYQRAEWRVCDSQIVRLASHFMGTPFAERIAGSDFFGQFCAYHSGNPDMRVFLLGAAEGVAEEARRRINRRVGRDVITHALSPSFGFERSTEEGQRIVDTINRSGCTVLAVGVGCPKQEKWIDQHRLRMPGIRIFMCIGATIDFEAGKIQRAPRWMQKCGMEWLFRMIVDPKRLVRRYLIDDMPFFWLLAKQRLRLYKSPF